MPLNYSRHTCQFTKDAGVVPVVTVTQLLSHIDNMVAPRPLGEVACASENSLPSSSPTEEGTLVLPKRDPKTSTASYQRARQPTCFGASLLLPAQRCRALADENVETLSLLVRQRTCSYGLVHAITARQSSGRNSGIFTLREITLKLDPNFNCH